MTDNTPWYMRSTDTTCTDKGSPERNRRHLESLAELASEEADSVASHLRSLEAKGVAIPAESRISMGYSANARKAAAQLDALPSDSAPSASAADLTPEQRIARGYGA
ncbi:hypothetical protein ACH4U7_18630 [Streptomyces sp. NPDC020845]|uniref:hypothetical protein n=1 Tax=Streptomyces sp. NPDC020845 TaxID=3365096 RepID=UPI0037AEFB02